MLEMKPGKTLLPTNYSPPICQETTKSSKETGLSSIERVFGSISPERARGVPDTLFCRHEERFGLAGVPADDTQ